MTKITLLAAIVTSCSILTLKAQDNREDKSPILHYDERMGLLLGRPNQVDKHYKRVYQYRRDQISFTDLTSDPLPQLADQWFLGIRLQDDLVSRDDRNPATFNWARDRNAESETALFDAALLLDIYAHTGDGNLLNYDPENMAFRLTVGAEWERNQGGDVESDVRRYTFGGEFNLFPKTMRNKFFASQPFKFAFNYQEDNVSGEEAFTFDLDYFPRFALPFWKNLVIGQRNFYQKDAFMKFVDRESMDQNPQVIQAAQETVMTGGDAFDLRELEIPGVSGNYFFLRPDIGVEFGDSNSIRDIVDNFSDGHFRYGLEAGLGLFENRVRLTYSLLGLVPFDGNRDSHLYHEASLSWKGRYTPTSINLTYQSGEQAPGFQDVDVFKIGLGARF